MDVNVSVRSPHSLAKASVACVCLLVLATPLTADPLCICGAPCDQILTSANSPAGIETFEACNTITASSGFEVLSPAEATLRAGSSITFGNDFSIGAGGEMMVALQPDLACDVLADDDMDGFDACLDCADTDDTRYPGADEICNGLDDDCNFEMDEIGGCAEYIDCQTTLVPPVSGDVCEVTVAGTTGLMLRGTILAPNSVVRGGEVLVDGQGLITCVGCDCSGASGAALAHEVTCADGVISPGLINTHDHLTYANNAPVDHGTERYDHRHEWRTGANGHTEIIVSGGALPDEMSAAELRFLMGGATSMLGSGSVSGLVRNLDRASDLEGLLVEDAHLDTFPLDDADGTMRTDCNYDPGRTTAAEIANDSAYLPHMAEGVNSEANNEVLCSTSGTYDLIEPQTLMVHGVALTPTDAAEMRSELAAISWSPRSNISLYGNTAPITLGHISGVPLSLGSDWIATGSMNLLRELRCADELNTNYFNGYLTDFELWQTVTTNAARGAGVEHGLGLLKPGYVADIAIFDGSSNLDHRAVLAADPEDVVLVLRGGEALYGDTTLISNAALGGSACEAISVCGSDKKACVAQDTGTTTLANLQAAAAPHYSLFYCSDPVDEPSCTPYRPGEYESGITASDSDGDGKSNATDLCPTVFDPIRPMDGGSQADADEDAIGDACDACPVDASNTCTPPDPDDLDGDGWKNGIDNCPENANPGQEDSDSDGHGDLCDSCPSANPGFMTTCVYPVEALRDPTHPNYPPPGSNVSVEDVYVTGVRAASGVFYVQNTTLSPFTGIAVSTDSASLGVAVGNRVDLTGVLGDSFGTATIQNAVVTVTDSGTTLPFSPVVVGNPADIATGGGQAEGYESMLLQVNAVVVTNANPDAPYDYDEFEVTGGLRVDDYLYIVLNNIYPVGTPFTSITGVHGYSFDNRKLWPRAAADIVP